MAQERKFPSVPTRIHLEGIKYTGDRRLGFFSSQRGIIVITGLNLLFAPDVFKFGPLPLVLVELDDLNPQGSVRLMDCMFSIRFSTVDFMIDVLRRWYVPCSLSIL